MEKEEKILTKAIQAVLNNIDVPVHKSELMSMLNKGYLDFISEKQIDRVEEEIVEHCINENGEIFDNYFGVISLKDQKYYSINEIENNLKEYLNVRPNSSEIDFVLFFLLFHRYAAVQDNFGLKELPTGQLIFRTYNEPLRLDCSVITNLINQFSKIYGGVSCKNDFKFDNEKLINQRLTKLAKIVGRIDWRRSKLSVKHFDKLISNLKVYYKFKDRSGELLAPKFSQFILGLIDFQSVNKIVELNSNLLESINGASVKIRKDAELEINSDQITKAIQSVLRVALTGYPNTKIDCSVISAQKKNDCDILISFPPFGNLEKSFWAENFSNAKIEISSLEELYTRLATIRLNKAGKAYLILPENFLSGNRRSLTKLREELTKKRWIDTIIRLPRHWVLPQAAKSANLVILNLEGADSTYFFDIVEYLKQNQNKVQDTLDSASELIRGRVPVKYIARLVNFTSILESNSNLSLHKYINPVHFAADYKRKSSEKIFKLSETTQRINPERHEVVKNYPFINMAELANDPSNFVLDLSSAPCKKTYSSKRPLLKEDAILIGTIGRVLKPTIFKFHGKPIFLGSNVIALRVDKNEVDLEYLVSELNSKFVADQVRKLPTGTTIPHVKRSDLLNIAIRVPIISEQREIFNKWITSIARNKIESLNIEKEKLFSEEYDQIHDMHHTLKNELSILKGAFRDIKRYLLLKSESKEVLNLSDPIREIKEGADTRLYDSVEQKLNATERSLDQMSSFVKDYKTILKFDPKNQNPEWIYLKDFLETLCSEYTGFDYNVIEETQGSTNTSGIEPFQLNIDKTLLRLIVTNIIENAKNHGFNDFNANKLIEFIIRDSFDESEYHDIKDSSGNVIDQVDVSDNWIELVIRNSGEIDGEEIDSKTVFERGYGKGNEKNRGIGLTHVQKAMKSLKGQVEIVKPDDSIFVFEIRLKFPTTIGKSPNWDTIDSFKIEEKND